MTLPLVLAAVTVAALVIGLRVVAHVINLVAQFLRKFRPLVLFLAGHPMDGQLRTDATFLRGPTSALHPTADRSRWHWRPGWHRGAIRMGAVLFMPGILAGLFLDRAAVENSLAALIALCAGAVAFLAARTVYRWARTCTWDREHPWKSLGASLALPVTHHLYYRRPFRQALTSELGVPPAKVKVPLDRSKVKVGLPAEFTGSDKDRESVERSVTSKLAIEAPEATWRLHGRKPYVVFVHAEPPPGLIGWDDVASVVRSLGPDELLTGIGKRSKPVPVSLTLDSPHFGISMGTGGGKSTLAAFWLVQELMRGSIVLILDAKRFSHPWAFKDMDAEYGQLPNVGYCRTLSDLHNAMEWLGVELDRRNAVAERTIDARGDVHGDVGPRLWVVAEELNLAVPQLKQYWAGIREKDDVKRSPALTGFGGVSFAGRAVKMHLIVIGQQLKADVLGGGDVRENIGVRCMARYTQNSWKMQAGDIAMPPSPSVPGRVQVLAGGDVREAQVPLVDFGLIRELAMSGTVTSCPAGMPGIVDGPPVPVLASASSYGASDLGVVLGQAVDVVVGMTIREAVDDGIFGPLSLDAARKRIQRARVEANGQRGDGSNTYDRAALFAAARKELAS